MSFYKRYQKAWDEQDISAMLDLYHPDYKRVFHAKGIEQGLDDLEPIMSRWLIGTKRNKRRCLYENEDIVVEHFVANFQDETTEAVLTVHLLKDGLLWRTHVHGVVVGEQKINEALGIWYPSHAAFLNLMTAPSSSKNMKLRDAAVEHADLHRCEDYAK